MAQETSNDSTMVDVQLGTLRIIMQGPFDRLSDQLRQEVVDGVALFSGAAREELHDITFKRGCIIFEAKIPQAALEQFFETLIQNDVDQGGEAALALRKFLQQHLVEEISDDRERKVELRTSVAITTSRTAAQQRAPSPATDVATLPDESRIVFVHGYIGDEGTFGAVPSLLEAATRIKSAVYTYPTSLVKRSPAIRHIARNLDNFIRTRCNVRRLAIIAHSMGGLIARKLIVEQKFRADPLDQRIRLVTLIASPYSGADLAATVSTLKSSAQLEDLHPGSDFIDELNEHWEGWYQRARPRDLTVRSIYAEADKIVPVDSARRLDPEAVPILGVGHTNIFDKANSDSEIVLTLRRFLAEAGMLTS